MATKLVHEGYVGIKDEREVVTLQEVVDDVYDVRLNVEVRRAETAQQRLQRRLKEQRLRNILIT